MAEYKTKPEIASQKRTLKLSPAIGDWTAYQPPRILTKKIKAGLYGFDRLSEDELDQALNIHYRFGESLVSQLKIDLRAGTELYSVQAEQTTYLNFLRSISAPVVQAKLKLAELHEGVALVVDLSLANSLINQALGSRDLEPIQRGLTEAENAVLETALKEYLPKLTTAFGNVFETPVLTIGGSPDLIPDSELVPTSTFIAFQLEISLAENPPGRLILGYLGGNLKTLLQAFAVQEQAKPLDFSRFPSALLNRLRVPLSATLGKTSLLTGELETLESGDVVTLDASIHSALPVSIGKYLTLLAQPGIKNKKNSIRISSLEPEEPVQISPPLEIKEPTPPLQPAIPLPEEGPAAEEPVEEEIAEEEFPEEDEFEDEFLEEEFPEEENKGG